MPDETNKAQILDTATAILRMQLYFFRRTADNAATVLQNQATLSKRQLLNIVEATKENAETFCNLNENAIKQLEELANG